MSKAETTSPRTSDSMSGPSAAPKMAPPDIQAFNPPLAWFTDNILFADNWKRASLAARDRSIVTLSTLIACGHTAQMVGHLGRGLTNGLKPTEIVEIIAHLAFYCGWPCAMSATNVMKQVFADRGITPAQLAGDAGALAEIKGPPAEAPSAAMRAVTPDLAEFTDSVVSGDLWLRPGLAPRDRSLATIAALIALGQIGSLQAHLERGLDNGLSQTEIGGAVTHSAFYAGWPKAMSAVPALQAAFESRKKA